MVPVPEQPTKLGQRQVRAMRVNQEDRLVPNSDDVGRSAWSGDLAGSDVVLERHQLDDRFGTGRLEEVERRIVRRLLFHDHDRR